MTHCAQYSTKYQEVYLYYKPLSYALICVAPFYSPDHFAAHVTIDIHSYTGSRRYLGAFWGFGHAVSA